MYITSFPFTMRIARLYKMGKADGSYIREISKIERQDLLILDDFGLVTIDNQNRSALMEIIEDRHNKASVIITSQLPVNCWHEVIGEKLLPMQSSIESSISTPPQNLCSGVDSSIIIFKNILCQ